METKEWLSPLLPLRLGGIMNSYLDIFESILSNMGLEIVSLNQIGNDLVEVIIAYKDSYDHVDLDTCAKAAQAMAEAVDYDIGLDVSSEGAERIIKEEDYESVVGSYVFVKLKNPTAGMDHVEGTLESISEDTLEMKYRFKHTHKTVNVERENIELLRLAVKI